MNVLFCRIYITIFHSSAKACITQTLTPPSSQCKYTNRLFLNNYRTCSLLEADKNLSLNALYIEKYILYMRRFCAALNRRGRPNIGPKFFKTRFLK